MKILFVNDDRNFTGMLSIIFEKKFGIGCTTFNNPINAIQYLESMHLSGTHADLLITDDNMPDMSGHELINWIRDSDLSFSKNRFNLRTLPIILWTAALPNQMQESLDIQGKLIIPVKIEEILCLVSNVIKNWRKRLFNEIQPLGISFQLAHGKYSLNYFVKVKRNNTEILSDLFLFNNKQKILSIENDFWGINTAIQEFEEILNGTYKKYGHMKEAIIQKFFERNPYFLTPNIDGQIWFQPNLSNRGIKIIPDFVVRPEFNYEINRNWNMVELKLPEDNHLVIGQK